MNSNHPTPSRIRQLPIILLAMSSTAAMSDPQDVHIASVLIANNGVVHVINDTPDPIPLDGWRFLTTDASGITMQSDPHALDGLVVSTSIPLSIGIDQNNNLGPFADRHSEAFALSLFFPDAQGEVSFDDHTQIADHLQWSAHGIHHPIANAHNQLAVDAGLWTEHDQWINAPEHIYQISMSGDPTLILRSPEDYSIIPAFCTADLNHDGNINFFDVSEFLAAFSAQHFEADMNNDGNYNFFDVSLFLNAYTTASDCF